MANETLTDVFSDIADAIRAKGLTGQMKPTEMSTKIADIPSGGSGDPLYEVNGQGVIQKRTGVNVNWFNDATSISEDGLKQAYARKPQIVSASFPNLTTIGVGGMDNAFTECANIESINISNVTTVGDNGMNNMCISCSKLEVIDLSKLTSISARAMSQAFRLTNLKKAYLKKLSNTADATSLQYCFMGCQNLEVVDFSEATAIPIFGTGMFNGTNSSFQIVVPDALYETWIAATNWSTYASQIVKASEYTPSN